MLYWSTVQLTLPSSANRFRYFFRPRGSKYEHIPVCSPKIAQPISLFPHSFFSDKRAAKGNGKGKKILYINKQRGQSSWFSFNLAKEAVTVMYKAGTFMFFKQPDLQRIPASGKKLQVCLLNYNSNNSYPAGQCQSFCQQTQVQEKLESCAV